MCYDFAPMEGMTDSIYRHLHHKYFPGVDRYYMPFFSPTIHRRLTHREERELPLADGEDFLAIPQLLTKVPEDFLWAAQVCQERGYEEVNLNLGCPSGTVVSKGKGSGMLRDLETLDHFLEQIFQASPLPISIKTRLGMEDPAEFPALLEIFNRYPIQELIIHPRVRKQFYEGSVYMEWFDYAVRNSRNPLCYNGDLCSLAQIEAMQARYPFLNALMIGRGLIADPGMLSGGTEITTLEAFMQELFCAYESAFGGSRNAIFRLKQHWAFLHTRFADSEKLWKRLRKTTDVQEFQSLSAEFFHTLPFLPPLHNGT